MDKYLISLDKLMILLWFSSPATNSVECEGNDVVPDGGQDVLGLCRLCYGDVYFCLKWRSVADAQVAPLAIVEDLDVFEEGGSGLTRCGELDSMHELDSE